MIKLFNNCGNRAVEALRFLSRNERPIGGEQEFNSISLLWIADELETELYRLGKEAEAQAAKEAVARVVAAKKEAIARVVARNPEDFAEPYGDPGEYREVEGTTTHAMPGTSGFTMAAFRADDVPVGTKLYVKV